jgi:hypothetical protein
MCDNFHYFGQHNEIFEKKVFKFSVCLESTSIRIGLPWMPLPISIWIRQNDADPIRSCSRFRPSTPMLGLRFYCTLSMYTVKKVFSFPVPGYYLPNSFWAEIIKFFPAREVSYIPAGDGKTAQLYDAVRLAWLEADCNMLGGGKTSYLK